MATPFESIYELFMENIGDRELVDKLSEQELKDTLQIYLLKAANLEFPDCVKDLKKVDLVTKCFLEDLDYEEMSILSYGMIVHYLEPKINRDEYYRLELGDRDFKVTGKDKILNMMINKKNDTKRQLRDYVLRYQYSRHSIL